MGEWWHIRAWNASKLDFGSHRRLVPQVCVRVAGTLLRSSPFARLDSWRQVKRTQMDIDSLARRLIIETHRGLFVQCGPLVHTQLV